LQEFKKFWPHKDDAAEDFGHFHVSFQNYVEDGLYNSTDFLLQSTQVCAYLFAFDKFKTKHTHTHNRFTAVWILSGTTQVIHEPIFPRCVTWFEENGNWLL